MVTISRSLWLLRDKLCFFTTEKDIKRLVSELAWNELLRIQHSPVDLSHHKRMLYKGVLRILCIDLTKDIDQIFREMKKITRREIRRAEDMSDDIEVRVNDERAKEDFLIIYNSFVKQKGHTHQLSRKRYKEILNNGDVFVLYFKGQPYAASLDITDYSSKRAYGYFLGSKRLNNEEDAKFSSYLIRYLYWYEIQTYKNKGFHIYDFGGGGGTGPGNWFKQSFGGSVIEEYAYVFAGSIVTYLFSKAAMKSWKLIHKIRALSNHLKINIL